MVANHPICFLVNLGISFMASFLVVVVLTKDYNDG